jgi:hypothetical protein
MAHLSPLPGQRAPGYDEQRSLLILPVKGSCSFNLFEGPSDSLTLSIEKDGASSGIAEVADSDVTAKQKSNKSLSAWERSQRIRKVTVKGREMGTARLRARLADGREWIRPLEIRVVTNPDGRQAADSGTITPALRTELQALGLKAAVLRIAEDQMYSKLGVTAHGGSGRYGLAQGVDWCGAFAHWCYKAAALATGASNPFGDSPNALASPQKAISWALQTGNASILQYAGGDPFGRDFRSGAALGKTAKTQKLVQISAANPVEPGDVCLVRDDTTWRHVCLVYTTPSGGKFLSIDGNQGSPSIRTRSRDLNEKLKDGKSFRLVFLHVP